MIKKKKICLSLNTAIHPYGHFRQVCAASVSGRQKEANYSAGIKSVILKQKDKNR